VRREAKPKVPKAPRRAERGKPKMLAEHQGAQPEGPQAP
jgi:hypothetical protein